ncbi:PfkB family carbohydrate kinase [Microlunatus soli]|uniref:Ribokinase n=1 Tax=Microlunatus soli TaxID=630515 RepID=A0A1H2AKB8_9ACTN|nr:PfkB family carbohydrate kinase [Microlunatus soli]SDT46408.1 ribokinase [Microlunatus soli]
MGGRVIVLGSLSQDLHLQMQRHPTTGETVMSGDIEYRYGGKGANQAVAAARAGAVSFFVGRVGADQVGADYRKRLATYGVDTSRLAVSDDAPTGTAIIYLNADHDNMIVVAPGANFRVGTADLDALDDLGPEDVLLMPLELKPDVVIAAVDRARAAGARIILNLAPYIDLPAETLAACDPVIVNELEHDLLQRSGLSCPSLLITRGTEGSQWGGLTVPAQQVEAVDTTGAGDAYCGTLAARLVRGDDPAVAMAAASAAAAANVQHPGAQPPTDQL